MKNALLKLYVMMQNLVSREDGQDLIEYALLVAIIALGAVSILGVLSGQIVAAFTAVGNAL